MSMPLAESRAGLPIGVQFVAPFGDEARLFRLGAQLEAAQPWAARRPRLVEQGGPEMAPKPPDVRGAPAEP
jgi:amidase